MDLDLDLDSASLFEEVDKSKVPPILQKRIIAFVNHFILKTCTFLNEFVEQCEIRFIETERQMQKLETSLIILEEKLASIPDNDQKSIKKVISEEVENNEENLEIKPEELEENMYHVEKGVKANEDPRYKHFFKMLQVGVQPLAVKQKMKSEGLNPDILDNPNQILAEANPSVDS